MDSDEATTCSGEGESGRHRSRLSPRDHANGDLSYKHGTTIEESGLEEVNLYVGESSYFTDEALVMRRFFCRGCGVLLDTELARRPDSPLWDRQVK